MWVILRGSQCLTVGAPKKGFIAYVRRTTGALVWFPSVLVRTWIHFFGFLSVTGQ